MWPGRGTVQSSMIPFGNCSLHSSCNSLLTRLLLLLYGAGRFLDCMEMCSTLLALPPRAVFCLQAQAVRAARFAGQCRVSVYISARLLPSHVKCCFRWCHSHTAAKAFITIAFLMWHCKLIFKEEWERERIIWCWRLQKIEHDVYFLHLDIKCKFGWCVLASVLLQLSLYFSCALSLYFAKALCMCIWQHIYALCKYLTRKPQWICDSIYGVCSTHKLKLHCWYKGKWLSFLSAERNSWYHSCKNLRGRAKGS